MRKKPLSKKVILSVIMLFSLIISKGQVIDNYYTNFSNVLSNTRDLKEIYKYAFMPKEFIVLTQNDTNLIRNYIFDRANYSRTKGEEYYYDMSINLLKTNLLKSANQDNQGYIEKLLSQLKTNENPQKPKVGWGKVFEICQTCYFGTYPQDVFTYFNFSLIFMGENEIKEMIDFESGEQWEYALMAIKGGDSFTLEKNSKYGNDVLDRRIASFIIKKWENCKIPEVQKLIAALKDVM